MNTSDVNLAHQVSVIVLSHWDRDIPWNLTQSVPDLSNSRIYVVHSPDSPENWIQVNEFDHTVIECSELDSVPDSRDVVLVIDSIELNPSVIRRSLGQFRVLSKLRTLQASQATIIAIATCRNYIHNDFLRMCDVMIELDYVDATEQSQAGSSTDQREWVRIGKITDRRRRCTDQGRSVALIWTAPTGSGQCGEQLEQVRDSLPL